MNKASNTPRKKINGSDEKQSVQKTISSMFTATTKSVLCNNQNDNILSKKLSDKNDSKIDGKRKITHDLDMIDSPSKMQKSMSSSNMTEVKEKIYFDDSDFNDTEFISTPNKRRHKNMINSSIKENSPESSTKKTTIIRSKMDDSIIDNNVDKLCDITKTTVNLHHKSNAVLKDDVDFVCDSLFDEPFEVNVPDTSESYDKFFEDDWCENTQELSLNSLQKCTVTDIKHDQRTMTLSVQHTESNLCTTVVCSGFWKELDIQKDDIVTLKAVKESQQWVIDNNNGFLVIKPETLVSGTTIVGGLFCSRRAVLTEKFRRIESLPQYGPDSSVMVIGNLVHELLQKALRQNINNLSDLTKLMNKMLQSSNAIFSLYAAEMSLKECMEQMNIYVPKIFEFIQHYVKGKKQEAISKMKDNFQGNIKCVHDIEENIWLPQLGIKGKIDVTVEVNIHNSRLKMMPLEIKTGKPSFSLEHKGQVILYTMMMSLTGQDTDVGLLLYLKENFLREIRSGHPEKRDLILLRNNLARYFARNSREYLSKNMSQDDLELLQLPEPINHHSACERCPYNTLCCAYASKDPNLQLSDSHPLTKVSELVMRDIQPSHIDYVIKWVSLLQLEESAQSEDDSIKDLINLSPEKREEKGVCVGNLRVEGKVTELCGKYQHTFTRSMDKYSNDLSDELSTKFAENEYVLVSTNTRINISAGFIISAKEHSLIVVLDRDVTKRNKTALFHIDKYSNSSSLFSFSLANIGGLLGDGETCKKLREIVIDKKPATFGNKIAQQVLSASHEILRNLNSNQQKAIFKVIAAEEYVLIKGMPGTGKTQTIVALIELLSKLGCSVLVTAHTHSAVDNILLKLLHRNIDFLRLGSTGSIHPLLKCRSEEYLTANCDTPSSLQSVYDSKTIIGVTCFGGHHVLLGKKIFDVCIVDESTQVLQPAVLRPLYSARKFVLVGDPEQLPPVARSDLARKLGVNESLFLRLDSTNNTIVLLLQYRMNRTIMNLANKLTYKEQLKAGNEGVETAGMSLPNKTILPKCKKWIQTVLSTKLEEAVIVVDTRATHNLSSDLDWVKKCTPNDRICCNIWEAGITLQLVQTLLQLGVEPENIGVIAPYRAQVNLLKKLMAKNIEVNTVDQYQGRDKDIILYSCVKSFPKDYNKKRDFELLEDHQRLTVAVTRAKHKLIIIADQDSIMQYTPFKKLFTSIECENILQLTDGHNDFAWNEIISALNVDNHTL